MDLLLEGGDEEGLLGEALGDCEEVGLLLSDGGLLLLVDGVKLGEFDRLAGEVL